MVSTQYTTIRVAQKDIDRATRNNSHRCVIATAIAGSIEGARRVSVDLQTVRFTVGDERFVYLTPPAAVGYVVAFDAGQPIHPFAFRLSENHRVSVRQDRKSDAGKERARTRVAAKKAATRAERAAAAATQASDPDDRDLAEAAAKVAQRDAAEAARVHSETVERLAGQPHHEPDLTPDPGTGQRRRKSPPKVNKTLAREYGSRKMRINQEPDDNREGRRGVTAAYDYYEGDDTR